GEKAWYNLQEVTMQNYKHSMSGERPLIRASQHVPSCYRSMQTSKRRFGFSAFADVSAVAGLCL
ncbi:hypothetical protein M514_12126, partial [Trichuris suis]